MNKQRGGTMALKYWLWSGIAFLALGLQGCATAPKKSATPSEPRVMSVIELTECGKSTAFFLVTTDGAVHGIGTDELSKEQIDGVDALAGVLPSDNAVEMELPCIPSLKTRFGKTE
jgi:hypothetical protein